MTRVRTRASVQLRGDDTLASGYSEVGVPLIPTEVPDAGRCPESMCLPRDELALATVGPRSEQVTSAVRWGWSSTRNEAAEAAVQRAFLPAFRCAQCYVAAACSPRKTSATSHTQKPRASCNMPDPTHVICRVATLKAPSFRLRTDKPATYALRV